MGNGAVHSPARQRYAIDPEPLRQRLNHVATADANQLRRRLRGVERRERAGQSAERGRKAVERAIEQSAARVERRRANLPALGFPEKLPVSQHREDLVKAVREHQVIVVCGETGSGKTTQLPKLALEAGQGVRGLIGHTQPRRLAARTVAARIAEEMQTPPGEAAGFKVRFSEKLGPEPYVKVMTDGILLAETQSDPDLRAYDTLIIDEAHERSLNIDFLLGYLKRLLPRRPDLKLIITSATIDPRRFAEHFGDAPVYEVSGRTYPVEMRYRPLAGEDGEAIDMVSGIVTAVRELDRTGRDDTLVFLPGERDIRETADALRREQLTNTEILPLYARLGARSQQKVFETHQARRIVLATNVAETSLTVPGIRYVIDPGLARIKRYSQRTRATRLPIEPVAQASADQRAGRCGRTGPGVCIRLYSEEDYQQRPRFTAPEIQRSGLASVILQMKSLGLGDIQAFPFVDPPDTRLVKDGLRSLGELHALDGAGELTDTGRDLARLPLDPQLGRMILAGDQEHALREILVIVSALSAQDPRERPAEQRQAADEKQARFNDPRSDFLAFVKLWEWQREQRRGLGRRRFSEACREHFLSPMRLREWQDVHQELLGLARELGLSLNREPADYANVHRALLTGLLNQIGHRQIGHKQERGEYLGPRDVRFRVHPGSGLFKKPPPWLMTSELVETTRLYAHTNARVEPAWIERAGAHLLKRVHYEPHWEKKPAQVVAYEQTSLFGLILSRRRKVHFGAIDPVLSREIFIRAALVRGDYRSPGRFQAHNRQLLAQLEEEEAKVRRRGIVADEQALFEFYARRIPGDVCRGAAFERWRKKAEKKNPGLLYLTREDLLARPGELGGPDDHPAHIRVAGLHIALEYHFEPGSEADGVTAVIPLAALNQLKEASFDWLVPGLLEEKFTALIKTLPKRLRRNVVPAPQFARAAYGAVGFRRDENLAEALAGALTRMTGTPLESDDFDAGRLPRHLRMRFRVVDDEGNNLAEARGLGELRDALSVRARQAFAKEPARQNEPWERSDVRDWDFGALPEQVVVERAGARLPAYPALSAADGRVDLRLFDTPRAARQAMHAGLRQLFALQMGRHIHHLKRQLPGLREMKLYFAPSGQADNLTSDLIDAALDDVFMQPPLPQDEAGFRQRQEGGRGELIPAATRIAASIHAAAAQYHALMKALKGEISPALLPVAQDIRAQADHLIYPGFISATPATWRPRLAVYLKAARLRLENIGGRLERDSQQRKAVHQWWQRFEQLGGEAGARDNPALMHLRWLIEEYRVSLFAQHLGTATKVSDKRLQEAAAAVARSGCAPSPST